jgi:hypothetical protein
MTARRPVSTARTTTTTTTTTAARLRRAGRLASRLRRLTQQLADDAIALEAAIGRLGIGPDRQPDRRSGRS